MNNSLIYKIIDFMMKPIFNAVIKPAQEEAFKEINQKLDQALAEHGINSSNLKLGHKIDALIALLKDKNES